MTLSLRNTTTAARHNVNGRLTYISKGRLIPENAPGGRTAVKFDSKGHIYQLVTMPRTGKRYRHANCMRNIIRSHP